MQFEDKHGNPIEVGDTVEFVHAGDPYEAVVDDLTVSEAGVPHLTVTISPMIPAGQAKVVDKAEKKSSHHKSTTKGSR